MNDRGARRDAFAERLIGFLDQVVLATRGEPALEELRTAAAVVRKRLLEEPMRIAVVGQIKKGKSTLVNALVGEARLPTGPLELSYNVNELQFADKPSITVHFKEEQGPDGRRQRPPEHRSIDELPLFTARDPARLEVLRAVRKVEVGVRNELLKSFRLIDTPGLNSVYADDARETLELLQLTEAEIQARSTASLGEADAIIFLFTRGLAADSRKLLSDVRGPVADAATPLRAVGVLSKCDEYWTHQLDVDGDEAPGDPLATGRRICNANLRHPRISGLFFSLVPVCALLAVGAVSLTDEDEAYIRRLADVPRRRRIKVLSDVELFAEEADIGGLSESTRRRLVGLLGGYGLYVASELIRDGAAGAELRTGLTAASGVPELRKDLLSHFGNRSMLIRADAALRALDESVHEVRQREPVAGADLVADLVQRFRGGDLGFAEVQMLGAYYRGELDLQRSQTEELRRVTREFGSSAPARLDLPTSTPIAEMRSKARHRAGRWRDRSTEPIGGGARRSAARVMARLYEDLADDLDWVSEFLDSEQGASAEVQPADLASAT